MAGQRTTAAYLDRDQSVDRLFSRFEGVPDRRFERRYIFSNACVTLSFFSAYGRVSGLVSTIQSERKPIRASRESCRHSIKHGNNRWPHAPWDG